MNLEQAAAYLGIGRSTLYVMIGQDDGPPSIKFITCRGKRVMRRFRKSDLNAWADDHVEGGAP